MTMARTIKLYKLPDTPATPGMREATAADAEQVRGQPMSTWERPNEHSCRPRRSLSPCHGRLWIWHYRYQGVRSNR